MTSHTLADIAIRLAVLSIALAVASILMLGRARR